MRRGRDACISRRLIRLHFAPAYSPAFRAGLFARISRRLIRLHFAPAYSPAFRVGLFARISRPLIASAFCFRILFLLFVPVFCSRISPR